MKKRWMIWFLILALLLPLGPSALAAAAVPAPLVDNAELLTEDQREALTELLLQTKEDLQIDIVIVTTLTLDGKDVMAYADDYYDQNGYGVGSEATGILLLLSMGTREWYMSTCGDARYIFTDYGLDQLGQSLVPYLSSGDYYDGFCGWVQDLGYYVDRWNQDSPVDGYAPPDAYESPNGEEILFYPENRGSRNLLIAVAVGLVSALVTVLIMRSTMNTAKLQSGAGDYLKNGSFRLTRRTDRFLYSRVSKTEKPQNNSGGGSSVHRSSGGVSHGGRGGKF